MLPRLLIATKVGDDVSPMGVNFGGERIPMPTYQFWYEYLVTIFCISQSLYFIIRTFQIFRTESTSRLQNLFRSLFFVTCITSVTQSSHYLTPGHPFLHWLGGVSIGLLLMFTGLCELQILKSFTGMTHLVTPERIKNVQLFFLVWGLLGFFLGCGLLPFLTTPPPALVYQIFQIQYQGYVLCEALYETWHAGFTSYLIIKNVSEREQSEPSMLAQGSEMAITPQPVPKNNRRRNALVAYLVFIFGYLWLSFLLWIYAYSLPTQANPVETAIRIMGNHMGLWYPFQIYHFLQLLKKVQFKERFKSTVDKSEKVMLKKLIATPSHSTEPDLAATRIISKH